MKTLAASLSILTREGVMLYLLRGVAFTCIISVLGVIMGLIVGSLLALARTYCKKGPARILGWFATAYIELFRNTPYLLWIFICVVFCPCPSFFARKMFGLTSVEMKLLFKAALALILFNSSVIAEIVRGGLKRVFVNVKSRGMLGEVQLEALLKEYFTESQYVKNVHPVPSKPKMVVEFAVKLPGLNGRTCLLPIDAKFPVEDYQRLLQAADEGDREGVAEARSKLRTRFRNEGKSIAEYINVPETTDFAIMFIPSEGLYAEALALEGLTNELFTSYRVYIMGPSTLASALCAYRAGFQTLAIEKKSSEIRKILSSVQTEFAKYGEVLNKLKSQVETVAKTVDIVQTKTRKMNLQLEVASESDKEEDQPMSLPSPVSNQSSLTSEQ